MQQRRTFADVYSASENYPTDSRQHNQVHDRSDTHSNANLSVPVVSQYLHQRYVQISVLGQDFPLLHERARCDTSTRVTCLLLDASSDWSSYTTARSASCRTCLHDPRTPATTSGSLAQTCNVLPTSAPVVQLSRQMQESATSVRPHVHAG